MGRHRPHAGCRHGQSTAMAQRPPTHGSGPELRSAAPAPQLGSSPPGPQPSPAPMDRPRPCGGAAAQPVPPTQPCSPVVCAPPRCLPPAVPKAMQCCSAALNGFFPKWGRGPQGRGSRSAFPLPPLTHVLNGRSCTLLPHTLCPSGHITAWCPQWTWQHCMKGHRWEKPQAGRCGSPNSTAPMVGRPSQHRALQW